MRVSTPKPHEEDVSSQELLKELRDFMGRQQSTEAQLFREIKDLREVMHWKTEDEWPSRESSRHFYLPVQSHISLQTPAFSRQPTQQYQPPPLLRRSQEPPQQQQLLPQQNYRREPKIPDFQEGEDVENFFIRFERMARTWNWVRGEWAARVVSLLIGKALEAYASMDEELSDSYDDIKAAVLAKYNVTEETYRQRFRNPNVPDGESVRETYNRLKQLYKRWMRPDIRNKEQMGETIMLEQYLKTLRPDVRIWVKENKPQTGEEAAKLAERYIAAHRGLPQQNKVTMGKPRPEGNSGWKAIRPGSAANAPTVRTTTATTQGEFRCFHCQQIGHKASLCPRRKPKMASMCYAPRNEFGPVMARHRHVVTLTVNGQSAKGLVDTGSTLSLVKGCLLDRSQHDYSNTVSVGCVHGQENCYPTADVSVEIAGQAYLLKVGVVENLACDVVLGDDLPILDELVNSAPSSCTVITRSQAKKGLEPLPDLDDELCEGGGKTRKGKQQCRQERALRVVRNCANHDYVQSLSVEPQWQIPQNFRELQASDPDLKLLFEKVCEVNGVEEPGFKGDSQGISTLSKTTYSTWQTQTPTDL